MQFRPQGIQGIQGIQGDTGATGATGPASDTSLYKFSGTTAGFTFDSTHGLPSGMNTAQTYKIRGYFKCTTVTGVPFLYLRFNGDSGLNYTYTNNTMLSTTNTVQTSLGAAQMDLTGTSFPNGYMVVYYEIEIMQTNVARGRRHCAQVENRNCLKSRRP